MSIRVNLIGSPINGPTLLTPTQDETQADMATRVLTALQGGIFAHVPSIQHLGVHRYDEQKQAYVDLAPTMLIAATDHYLIVAPAPPGKSS